MNMFFLFTLQVSVQPLRTMEGWDNPHPCIHHCGLQLHHILNGNSLVWKVAYCLLCLLLIICQYNSLNFASFSDLSAFPYILGPAAEPLLDSQGAVIHILTFFHSYFLNNWLFCLHRLECWLRCSPLSLVSSPLMTCGEMSGTSCLCHCRLASDCSGCVGDKELEILVMLLVCFVSRIKPGVSFCYLVPFCHFTRREAA